MDELAFLIERVNVCDGFTCVPEAAKPPGAYNAAKPPGAYDAAKPPGAPDATGPSAYDAALARFHSDKYMLLRRVHDIMSFVCDGKYDIDDESMLYAVPSAKRRTSSRATADKVPVRDRCAACTHRGERCTRAAPTGSVYCGLHKTQPYGNMDIGYVRKKVITHATTPR